MPISLLVIGVNYFIDPANLFSSRSYVSDIATLMTQSNNVDNVSNYDERTLQLEVVKRLDATPDCAILGSSRIMEIGSAFFPEKSVRNLGVSHANIYDIVSIVGLLDSLGKLPSEVYLNVDPGLFEVDATGEWKSLEPYFRYMAIKYGVGEPPATDWNIASMKKELTLFSFEYFQQAIQFLWKGGNKKVVDVGNKTPTSYGRFADGTISYPDSYTRPDTLVVAKIAVNQVVEKKSYKMDPVKEKVFLSLIKFLKEKSIKVHFVLIPYHMLYLQAMNDKFNNVFTVYETKFIEFASTNGFGLIGSFDPGSFGLTRDFFYDSFHCNLSGIKKIFKIQ